MVGAGEPAARLLVVGTGLIGTSVALAARAAGYEVWLDDVDHDRLRLAVSVEAGRARDGESPAVDLVVVAVPPFAVASVVSDIASQFVHANITHVASVQAEPERQVETVLPRFDRFVGGHPVAGRERSGPHHASADLFRERPWIVCATPSSRPTAVRAVTDLATACGAVTTEMTAAHHDAVLARLSHLPQLLASALAGSLLGLDRGEAGLAGTGLRDTSRLADSDATLWAEIVTANPVAVAAALRSVIGPLTELLGVLDAGDPGDIGRDVADLLRRGHRGRQLLAGKHGQRPVQWASVAVVVPDEPGRLARLLADTADAAVNVEDIRVDHSPGQPLGIVELDVAVAAADSLATALGAGGWAATVSMPSGVPGAD
jgi:prephenate dehydrogenase